MFSHRRFKNDGYSKVQLNSRAPYSDISPWSIKFHLCLLRLVYGTSPTLIYSGSLQPHRFRHHLHLPEIYSAVSVAAQPHPWQLLLTTSAGPFDSIIAIALLIKGDTVHFQHIAESVSRGLMRSCVPLTSYWKFPTARYALDYNVRLPDTTFKQLLPRSLDKVV